MSRGVFKFADCSGCRQRGAVSWAALVFVLGLVVCHPVSGAPKTDESFPPQLDVSISKGLAFLAKQQNGDGGFDNGGPKVAATSLSLLAFLSTGNVPDLGKYGLTVRGAIEWLLSQQAQDGYFGSGERGMYAHAIATLALAEAYGVMSNQQQRVRTHTALLKAVKIIVDSQNTPKSNPVFVGGWRYERASPDSDLSVSGWNILALRAAQDAGIAVPSQVRQRAVDFVLRCHDATAKAFAYQPGTGAQPGDTAIGIVCLYLLDANEAETVSIDGAIQYLASHPIDDTFPYPYYATYYLTQAAFQRGGDASTKLSRPALDRLVRIQDKDGGWPQSKGNQEPGRSYSTAMAVQALAVSYRLLPIYQR